MANLPKTLVDKLRSGEVIPFVGAGVSMAVRDTAGAALFPSWGELLRRAVARLREEQNDRKAKRAEGELEDGDYLSAARTARDGLGAGWYGFLREQFDRTPEEARAETLELARAVWRLGSKLVITTNYDRVLRWAHPKPADARYWTVSDKANLAALPVEPTVWHLHGAIDRPEDLVLTPDGYELLYPGDGLKVQHEAALATFRHLLTQRTMLFIGFGMEQAVRDQIRWVRETFAGAGGQHFVLVTPDRREALEKDLDGLSVQCVPYEAHGAPLLALMREMAHEATCGPKLTPAAPVRLDADPKPYLEYLLKESGFIEMRGLQVSVAEAPRFPIGDLYIPLMDELGERGQAGGEAALERALEHDRLVILGDPGAGKTTFLRRLAHQAAAQRLADPAAPFPILLRVADLAEFVQKHPRQDVPVLVPRFLAERTQELTVPLDDYFFEQRLTQGPCLLLVDGLDETPNEASREAISQLLARAADAWPRCRMVVTTRPQAYAEEVMLTGFHHARIGPLGREAVRTFLRKWAAALFRDDAPRAKKHGEELIEAVESRAEIRRVAANPVMLTALAVLHWNEKRMPEQRADLYESILTWLARSRKRRPGRQSPEACIASLQELAGAMQGHPEGRKVQASHEWAAEVLAGHMEGDALAFLKEEEADSGIVVNRGADVRFWHLTFQEYLAARLLAGMKDDERHQLLFAQGLAWKPEWREVVLLLAGVLYRQRATKVDALVTAALDDLWGSNLVRQMFHWAGVKPHLAGQARTFALLGAMLRDLQPLGYQPADARFAEVREAVLGIFDAERSESIPLRTRLEAADALGQAGDPRLRTPRDKDYWVRVEGFEIGKYPVTVWEYARFVEDGGAEPNGWEKQLARQNSPVTGVSWHDAKAYCDWAGVRLPTGAEWERAARGAEGREYAWGNEALDVTRANHGATKLGRVSPVGLFPRGSTPEGIADLAGNAWEWCADWHDGEKEYRNLRGGSWYNVSTGLRAAYRSRYRPESGLRSVGFRCARE